MNRGTIAGNKNDERGTERKAENQLGKRRTSLTRTRGGFVQLAKAAANARLHLR